MRPELNIRQQIHVTGVVQGVGFRPFVYALATQLGLTGFVGNDSSGVFIEIEGAPAQIETFVHQLQNAPPPLAHIEQISTTSRSPTNASGFAIVESKSEPSTATFISPDLSTCVDCLHELFDPTNRRHLYPFINCTNCGPRFTITKELPYDRPLTTMADFAMCPACQGEYDDPLNRRFHAQPNACADCGPSVEYSVFGKRYSVDDQQIDAVQQLMVDGGIVAVKGLGGFHLACDATNERAVQELRRRKGRPHKPFAIMAADVEQARTVAHINQQEETLLTSNQRPIVLLQKRTDSPLADSIAPGNNAIGIMLPYTPLHYLLFQPTCNPATLQLCNLLLMTSANFSGQPIIKENAEANTKLVSIADGILLHNRDIHTHCDDSVVRLFRGVELPIRRSRGYAPFPIKLPFAVKPTLAVGGELKSTFCLAHGHHAFMSQHIGDMENLETLEAFSHSVDHLQAIFRIEPELVACDLHPGYLSTRWAKENHDTKLLHRVQHHHAHIAAVMAENGVGVDEQVIGFAFDGTGYGRENGESTIWGGEVLVGGYRNFERMAHLSTVPLPGGDAAIQKPYRMALAHLWVAGVEWGNALPPVEACPPTERTILKQQMERRLNTIETSSMGRLFDAVAALAGGCQTVTYEGQAAIEFEALADPDEQSSYAFDMAASSAEAEPSTLFDAAPVIRAVVADVQKGVPVGTIATRFHRAVANLIVDLAQRVRDETQLNLVALSGGVFQNMLLLDLTAEQLERAGFDTLTHRLVPPNDGGLALGQAVLASSKRSEHKPPAK